MIEKVYCSMFGHSSYSRFAIISNARTGSNYLRAGLITSNVVRVHGEIFSKHKKNEYDRIYSVLFDRQPRRISHVGCKIFYYHLSDSEWGKFSKESSFKIIHLVRKNYLRTVVSLAIAGKTNEWLNRKNNVSIGDKRVELDPKDVVKKIDNIVRQEALTRSRFQNREIIEVAYEELTANPEEEFKRIGEYLDVSGINVSMIPLKKQNPEPLEELIVNYAEVVEAVGWI